MRFLRVLLLLCFGVVTVAAAQAQSSLQVRELTLSNGMKVWLNEDHTQPKVFGAVVVNAGAVDCPNTGIAHYFEHIMFKGTDSLGTVDYAAEKVLLDSISMKYDELALTTDGARRQAIQADINRLNIAASDYAIPNEFNRLITECGGSGLNAGTSYDFTYYHNSFAPQYIEQWCELNSHRLIHPVFRLFQGELETVYEEKNMYSDNPLASMGEHMLSRFMQGTPYEYPVIGSTENLKNPRLSEMEAFYRKYYVASNMGLVLCGDIDSDALLPLLERTFGRLQRGVPPARPVINPPAITGQPEEKFLMPVPLFKISVLAYRAPTDNDTDAPALDAAMKLLSNDNKTGLLDELTNNNKVMMATVTRLAFNQAGGMIMLVVPKLLSRRSKAEEQCLAQIEKVKLGQFSDEQLHIIKQTMLRDCEQELEAIDSRSEKMVQVMSTGRSWADYLRQVDGINSITRDDVMRVTAKYFTSNYIHFTKKMGKYPVDRIAKPDFTPVIPSHIADKSAFAKRLEQIAVSDRAPRLVDCGSAVAHERLAGGGNLLVAGNPANDIFRLDLTFHKGTQHDRLLEAAGDYVQSLGTDSLTVTEFGAAMQRLGATLEIEGGQQSTTVTVTGYDRNFGDILRLVGHFLSHSKDDNDKLDDIKDSLKSAEKAFEDENTDVFAAVYNMVALGAKSTYLTRLTHKELKKIKGPQLTQAFRQIFDYRCDVSYSGSLPAADVARQVQAMLPQTAGTLDNPVQERDWQPVASPQVYVYNLPDARQTIVGYYRPVHTHGDAATQTKFSLWGEYFGGGMSSVLFQQVREFRSLAYGAQGYAINPLVNGSKAASAYLAALSTQGDKTMLAVPLLDSLINNLPAIGENFVTAKQSMLNDINNEYPSFRQMPVVVNNWNRLGYQDDPRAEQLRHLPALTLDDVQAFHRQHIQNQPYALIIVGNIKQIDLRQLQRYGTVTKLKQNDIYKKK